MSRKIFIESTQETNEDIISLYIEKKRQYDELDKEVKKLTDLVKQEMKNKELKNVECNGYKVTRTESQRMTWKEDLLLAKVKTYNNPELVKHIEQVNVVALEQCVMDGTIDIKDLEDCQQVTEVVSLRMSKVKEKAE